MGTLTTTALLGGTGRFKHQNSSWAAARGAATATENFGSYEINAEHFAGTWYIQRIHLPFNETSLIPVGSTIDSVVLNFNANYEGGYLNTVAHLVESTQSSTGSRDADDYNNFNFVSGGSVAISDLLSTAKSITGNATAKGWIVIGGTTKLGVLASRDQSNTDPNGTFSEWASLGSFELVVGYTTPGGVAKTLRMNQAVNRASTY